MSANSWYVPLTSMNQTNRNRQKVDSREKHRENLYRFRHCLKCSSVYRKASFDDSAYKNTTEERYPTEVMPSYGLEKKDCSRCR